MKDLAYVNGVFSAPEEAFIPINDRGLLFGDSVYEVIKAFGKTPFLLKEHLERLERSASALHISVDALMPSIHELVEQGLKKTNFPTTLVYIQLTRGTQPRNLIFDPDVKPNLIATFRPYQTDVKKMQGIGVKAALKYDIRWGHCNLKTTNLLGNVLMKNEAAKEGCFEAILFTDDNKISEACSSSVFTVKNGVVFTTPSSENILPGVNRKYVLDTIGPQLNLQIEEKHVSKEELLAADEVFITSTTILAMPVIEVDGQTIASGKPGAVTSKIMRQFDANVSSLA